METTLVLIKPDGVARKICGDIINRFERRGFTISGMKLMKLSREQAERHYAEHTGKPFFTSLVNFITSGPLVALAVTGENAIKAVRSMMGPTNPLDAAPGTIRGDFALTIGQNIIHGSDSPESAVRELGIFFEPDELL
ncbi:MAG: nucleoside-diphosphate kinase [Negativicutes bacterium]|nr:nucleoside-diphosphate kinase [Negativicutes bacterium]